MKLLIKRIVVITGNWIVLILLSLNLLQLRQLYSKAQADSTSQLLSNNPDQLLKNIQSSSPALWMWIVSVVGFVVSLFIVVSWFVPKLRRQLWFWRLSLIWLLVWLAYFVFSIIVLIILVNSLFNGGQ